MIKNQDITEYRDAQNFAYTLKNPSMFFPTGYKVMQTRGDRGFIRCTRILHNGKDKLLYDIAPYKT